MLAPHRVTVKATGAGDGRKNRVDQRDEVGVAAGETGGAGRVLLANW